MLTGKQIREARNRAGWSQGELAEMLSVTLRSVGNWERGQTSPQSREPELRRILGTHLRHEEAPSDKLHGVSDMELISELARRLARTDQSQEEVGNHGRSAPITQAGEDQPAHDDELAARRTPHRERRVGHDPEWDQMYGHQEAAHDGIPGEEIGQEYTDEP